MMDQHDAGRSLSSSGSLAADERFGDNTSFDASVLVADCRHAAH
jgi:hypothetical protein